MSEENVINQELLEIIKALSSKIESLEKAVYNDDNLLMKSGFVVANTPTPHMENVIGSSTSVTGGDISKMDWEDIHKMVENMGGQ